MIFLLKHFSDKTDLIEWFLFSHILIIINYTKLFLCSKCTLHVRIKLSILYLFQYFSLCI